VAAAVESGAHIVDTAMGAAVRWYGQGDVLSTAAYLEEECGSATVLEKKMIGHCNFVLKQIMPYYDRYTAPYFQGVDYEVVEHAMPGGATSSSQEGAMKQGYIHLLPYMLRFLAGTRRIVRYHDVTPGSQITWNTAFLAVTEAYKRGKEKEVLNLLQVLETVINTPERELSNEVIEQRLQIYRDSNDAFRDLLLGRFGKLPLGFPPDWVYESAFGSKYKEALRTRTEMSPLDSLEDADIDKERAQLIDNLGREPTNEELIMYLNHPGDAIKTIHFRKQFGDQNLLPLHVWFEGLEVGQDLYFSDKSGKPHHLNILGISEPNAFGKSLVRYILDSEHLSMEVQVEEALPQSLEGREKADPNNPYHVAAPCAGDLWVVHVKPGDKVKTGQEVCNISIMKQEKAVLAGADGIVKRVLVNANFQVDKKMVPVKDGDLLVELGSLSFECPACKEPAMADDYSFCPRCGHPLHQDPRG
jgi:pyruvate carboxylase